LRGYTLPVAVAALLFTGLVAYTTRPALRLARQARRPATWWAQGLQALALALAVVLIGRGGWQSKPLSVDMAFRGPDMALGHLTLNAAFTTAHAAAARRHSLLEYYPDAQAQGRVRRLLGLQGPPDDPGYPLAQQPVHRQPDTQQPVHRQPDTQQPVHRQPDTQQPDTQQPVHRQPDTQQEPSAAPVRPPNLVVIVLESFSTQLVGALGGPPGLTPNLDRLAGEGVLFTEFFAAGTRSIEGIAAILTGYPALPHSQLIGSPLAQNNLQSLPRILRSRGYQMLFLHGAFRGSMWFDHFASLHGFQRYIAQEDFEDYPSKSDGAWGIFDHHALERLNRELEQTPGPVFAFFFSLSSHTPYALPEGTPRKFGPEIPQADMLNSYAYTDQALGRFFERARQSDSWRNTIFVVTADHNKGEREYSPLERMRVPLLIIAPGLEGLEPGSRSDAPGSHLDIAPTVLDLLGLSAPHNFLGRPLLAGPGSGAGIAPREFRAMLSWGGQAGWLTGEMLLTHDLKKPLGLFNWRQDPALKHNLLAGGGPGGSAVVVAGSDPVAEFQSYLQTTNNLLLTNRVFPARWLQESGRSPAAAR
ncbi:MAG: sulfatase-like hydrolase/transferase, partial [Deltaproteobacteria bacterium]|nr:sulfatase-like hydrolase/transferase [Deltaproteobacteria bacterium]